MLNEPTDNIPMEWPRRGRTRGREMISAAQFRRRMVDFAKFVAIHATDMNDTLEPEELLDAWLAMTFPTSPPTPLLKARGENH